MIDDLRCAEMVVVSNWSSAACFAEFNVSWVYRLVGVVCVAIDAL